MVKGTSLYTVGADGSAKTKATTAVTLVALQGYTRPMSPPSWSPDGQRLAFSTDDWKEPGVYLVRPDGSDLQRVSDEFARSVSWSPDGSELLVAADGVSVIQVDGSVKRELFNEQGELPMLAAWSPDGTRIVVVAGRQRQLRRRDSRGINSTSSFPPWIRTAHTAGSWREAGPRGTS